MIKPLVSISISYFIRSSKNINACAGYRLLRDLLLQGQVLPGPGSYNSCLCHRCSCSGCSGTGSYYSRSCDWCSCSGCAGAWSYYSRSCNRCSRSGGSGTGCYYRCCGNRRSCSGCSGPGVTTAALATGASTGGPAIGVFLPRT